MSESVWQSFLEQKFSFIGASSAAKLVNLYNLALPNCKKPGDFVVVHRAKSNETYVLHYVNERLKRWSVLSNCHGVSARSPHVAGGVPVYDTYKSLYNGCDRINKQLAHRYWPFARGGSGRSGTPGQCHSFAFSLIVRNILNVYFDVNKSD